MHEPPAQPPLVFAPIPHDHGRELAAVGRLLDEASDVFELVQADLLRGVKNPKTGRRGMSGALVLRVLVIKQMNGFSYEELAFHLLDSSTYRTFCGIGFADDVPSAKTLQRNIKKLQPETLQAVHCRLMGLAQTRGIEDGAKVRGDCPVTESNIHYPSDSALLDDCARVLTRLMYRAKELVHFGFTDHTRRARRRTIAIQYAARKLDQIRGRGGLAQSRGGAERGCGNQATTPSLCGSALRARLLGVPGCSPSLAGSDCFSHPRADLPPAPPPPLPPAPPRPPAPPPPHPPRASAPARASSSASTGVIQTRGGGGLAQSRGGAERACETGPASPRLRLCRCQRLRVRPRVRRTPTPPPRRST